MSTPRGGRERAGPAARPVRPEPVAITGLGCRFPRADGPDAYWQMLREGRDGIVETPSDRWSLDEHYDPDPAAPGTINSRFGGFLPSVDRFDLGFFGLSAAEASAMDPQQRLLLEVTWEALEDAGLVAEELRGSRTAVFNGIMYFDYGHLHMTRLRSIDALTGPGIDLAVSANRVSYLFDLKGPSLAINTACSSSLVAVHLACDSLRGGECDLAFAGGVNLMISPASSIFFTKAGLLAPDGRCKAFDAAADGLGRGEGCGMVVLKLLERAVEDGDRIYAVILGSAMNQDGATNGLGAPNRFAQEAVLRSAFERAGVTPGQLQYVEAHGTGTPLGDSIEARALGRVVGGKRSEPCSIGSVKSNIGHLEAAAGVAGLIKVALMLRHQELVPSLHFQTPNPAIAWNDLGIRVQQRTVDWPRGDTPRIAGVTGLGFGGTNAHVVLREAPLSPASAQPRGRAPAVESPDVAELLTVSARSPTALRAVSERLAAFLKARSATATPTLADVCFTRNARGNHHQLRRAVVARTKAEMSVKLETLAGELAADRADLESSGARSRAGRVVFVFDDAAGWPAETVGEVLREVAVRSGIDDLADLMTEREAAAVRGELEGVDGAVGSAPLSAAAAFCLQMSVANRWRSLGIEASGFVGRGAGELVARCLAGELSVAQACRLLGEAAGGRDQAPGLSQATSLLLEREEPDAFLLLGPAEGLAEELAGVLERHSCRALIVPTLNASGDSRGRRLRAVAALYTLGAEIAWKELYPNGGRCVSLPSYPWQRESCWLAPLPQPQPQAEAQGGVREREHSLLDGYRRLGAPEETHLWEVALDRGLLSMLEDHRIDGTALMPGACYVEMAAAGARRVLGPLALELSGLQLHKALFLHAGAAPTLQMLLSRAAGEGFVFRIGSYADRSSLAREAEPTLHASGSLALSAPADDCEPVPAKLIRSRCNKEIAPADHYRWLSKLGFDLGPHFRPIRELRRGEGESLARVEEPPDSSGSFYLHPALLDSSFQVLMAATPDHPWDGHASGLFLPVSVDLIRVNQSLRDACWSHGVIRHMDDESLRGDVAFFDESGSPIVEILGLHSRWIDGRTDESSRAQPENGMYEVEWTAAREELTALPTETHSQVPANWLVLADEQGVGRAFAAEIERGGGSCVVTRARELSGRANALEPLLESLPSPPTGILHLGNLDGDPPRGADNATLTRAVGHIGGVVECVRALSAWRRGAPASRLWLATAGVHALDGDAPRESALARAPLWGLGRALALEHPSIWGGLIDLPPNGSPQARGRSLLEAIRLSSEDQVAVRSGGLFVPRLRPLPRRRSLANGLAIRSDATYLISGGLGGLGLLLARWLADRGARHLVLLSRSGLGAGTRIDQVEALRAAGVRVFAEAIDVTDSGRVGRLRDSLGRSWPAVRGVIHAAGLALEKPVIQLREDEIAEQLSAKVEGALLLNRDFGSDELDFFVLFSSVAALLSTHAHGLAAYAAGNSFLDAMARHLRARGRTAAVSINWGPWRGVGLAAGLEAAMEKRGIGMISPAAGLAAFESVLRSGRSQVAVMPMDWATWRRTHPRPSADRLAAALPSAAGDRPRPGASDRDGDEAGPTLDELVARYLPAGARGLDRDVPLTDLGLDSLAATELANRIDSELGADVPVVKLLAGPSLTELERLISGRSSGAGPEVPEAQTEIRDLPASLGRAEVQPRFATVKVQRDGLEAPPPLPWAVDYASVDYSCRPMLHRLVRAVVGVAVRALGRVEHEGLDRIPESGPVIIAYNHLSRLDKFGLIALQRRRCALFGAGRGRYRPWYRWCVDRLFDVIYIDRGSADMAAVGQALDLLGAGGGLIMAPEGEMSDSGVLMRGHTGVAFMAARTGATVVPLVAWGHERASRSWSRLRRAPIRVRAGMPISPPERQADAGQLRRYTDRLMERMASMLPPEYRGAYRGIAEAESNQSFLTQSRTEDQ